MTLKGALRMVLFAGVFALMGCASKGQVASSPKFQRPALTEEEALRLKYFYYEAINQQSLGHYDAAFDLLTYCLTIDPYASEVYSSLATYYMALEQDSMALASVKKAVELNPKNDTYREQLAITYVNSQQYSEAIETYEQLYANNKERTDVLKSLGQLYEQEKDYDNLLLTLERMEEAEGNSEQITLSKMRIYALKGEKDKEFETLNTLAESHPYDLNYRVMIGNWLLQNNRNDEALAAYQQVMAQEPNNQAVRMSMLDYYRTTGADSMANVLQEQILIDTITEASTKYTLMRKVVADNEQNGGDSTQVLNLFKRILAEPQSNSRMIELYAAYMSLKKMPQDSIDEAYCKALRIEPENVGVRIELIQDYWKVKNYNAVIEESEQAIEYNPDLVVFYYFLGAAHVQNNDNDKALNAVERGLAQVNDNTDKELVSELYAMKGDILHQKGQKEDAYEAYESSLKWKDDNIGALNNYAYYLSIEERDLSKAEKMSLKTIKADPTNATYLDTYAWILFQQKRYAEAKIYIDETLQNDSVPSGILLEHAGDIYAMNQLTDEAVDFWQRALDAGNDSKALPRKLKLRKYIKQ